MQRTSYHPAAPSRVLFVPENLVTGELRESFLDRASFLLRTAQDADIALAMAEVWHPSIVIFRSDLGALRVSDFCARLRDVRTPDQPKLIMLTETCGDPLDDALDANVDCHLISPVPNEQLLATIGALLEVAQRRAPRAALETLVHTDGFCDPEPGAGPALGNSINVSEDGILLECNRQLRLHAQGELRFFLPGADTRLALHGVVQLAVDEVRLHYAIEFTGIGPNQRAQLRDYIAEGGGA